MENLNNKKRLRTSSSSLIFNHQSYNSNNNNNCNNSCNNNNNHYNIIINNLKNQINKLEIENQNVVKEKEQLQSEIEKISNENVQFLINIIDKETQITQWSIDYENLKNETNQLLYVSYQQNEQLSNTIEIFKKENDNLIMENQQLKQDMEALRSSFNQFLEINEALKKSESEKHDKILMLELKLDYLKNQYNCSNSNSQHQQQQQPQFQLQSYQYHQYQQQKQQQQQQPNFENEFKLYQETIKLKENIQFLKELLFKKDKEVKELKSSSNSNEKLELSNTVISHLFDEISKLKQIDLGEIKTIVHSLINGNEYDVFGSEFKNCSIGCNSIIMKSKLTKHFKELSLLVHPDKCNMVPYHLFSKLNTYYDNLKKLYNNNNQNNNNNSHHNNNENTVY